MSGIRVEKKERCVMIRMERGDNRLNKEFVGAVNQALDAAERYIYVPIRVYSLIVPVFALFNTWCGFTPKSVYDVWGETIILNTLS